MMLTLFIMTAAALIALRALAHLDAMDGSTGHALRTAWLLIATGAIGLLLAPVFGHPQPLPWPLALLLLGGQALLFLFEYRTRGEA